MWWHFLEVQNMLFEDMVFMKKIVMLSRKGTFFFFFFFRISFPSTRHLLFFIPFFSVYSSVSNPRTLHTPPYPLPRRSSLSTGLLVKATALRAELRTSQKEFGDNRDPNITQHSCFCRQPLPLGQTKSDVTECRELFKANISSAVWRGRYYSVLLKPDLHCGGLSFGSKILLSQGCKYAR